MGFYDGPQIGNVIDQEPGGEGFYSGGPAYQVVDPVVVENFRDEAAASAAASEASRQASQASATAAASSASTATTEAGIATTQAGIATTQAGNASSSASAASGSASAASTSATNAHTSEVNAASSASAAAGSASAASTSAGNAASSASAASTSASNASTSAGNAASSASAASTSATNAATAVQAAAGTATPLIDGVAAVGSSTKWAHEDHKHPTDTTRAAVNSPTFTGTPEAPDPTTTQGLATKNYVDTHVASAGVSSIGTQTGALTIAGGNLSSSVIPVPRYDASQTLTATQQSQIQSNINAMSATVGSFEVDRNGTDQTGLTASANNAIVWTNANVNNQSWFSTSTGKYTPQSAGTYMVVLSILVNGGTSGETGQAIIYKNGSMLKAGLYFNTSGNAGSGTVSYCLGIVTMNGTTDYLQAYAYLPAGITTLRGNVDRTNFQAWRISS